MQCKSRFSLVMHEYGVQCDLVEGHAGPHLFSACVPDDDEVRLGDAQTRVADVRVAWTDELHPRLGDE